MLKELSLLLGYCGPRMRQKHKLLYTSFFLLVYLNHSLSVIVGICSTSAVAMVRKIDVEISCKWEIYNQT